MFGRDRRRVGMQTVNTVLSGLGAGLLALVAITCLWAVSGYPASLHLLFAIPVWLSTRTGRAWAGAVMVLAVAAVIHGIGPAQAGELTGSLPIFGEIASLTVCMLVFEWLEHSIETHRREALYDPLTGLLNLRGAREFGYHLIRHAKSRGGEVAVVMVDVDGLKRINDVYGHAVGDEAIRAAGHALQQGVRGSDVVARIGGDEFLVVLSGADSSFAATFMQRVHDELRTSKVAEFLALRVSAGAASLRNDGDTLESLMERADGRMFQQKSTKSGTKWALATIKELAMHEAPPNDLG